MTPGRIGPGSMRRWAFKRRPDPGRQLPPGLRQRSWNKLLICYLPWGYRLVGAKTASQS